MTPEHKFALRFAYGTPREGTLLFSGSTDEPALPRILEAFRERGVVEDGVTGLALSPADVFDPLSEVVDSQFLMLTGEETLGDLRAMIGTNDETVVLRVMGWGGPDLHEVVLWTMNDLVPVGRNLLEAYGALQTAVMIGRAVERRRRRELRREAEYWVRSDADSVQGVLRDAVERMDFWDASRLENAFGLTRSEAARLMAACGYDYDPASKGYVSPRQYF